jgi:serine/threonine-protein kinase
MPVTLCDAPDPYGADWSGDDTIIFTPKISTGLSRIPASGGSPQVLTKPDVEKGENEHDFPQILPGGEWVLFTLWESGEEGAQRIEALSLETGERKALIVGGSNARYVPTGHLIYTHVESITLMAVPFDLARLEVTGPPAPVLQDVLVSSRTTASHFSFSHEGLLVFAPRGALEGRRLLWLDRDGQLRPFMKEQRQYDMPRFSPDGRRLALTIKEAVGQSIWIYDLEREALSRLTRGADSGRPVWTPDGSHVTYASFKTGVFNLFWKPADGSGEEEHLLASDRYQFPNDWTPDGRLLTFGEEDPATGTDLWVLPREGERTPRPLVREGFNQFQADTSTDGRWLAYVSDESGRDEVYVQPFAGSGGKWQISTDGGFEPRWSMNGREIIYSTGSRLMAVPVATAPSFSARKPRILFEFPPDEGVYQIWSYDVTANGQQLVLVTEDPESAVTRLNVVLNWFEELKRLVPTESD